MPIDASIPLQVKNPQFMGPQDVLSLQNLARQSQLGQIQLQEAQQRQQENNALRGALGKPGAIDPTTGAISMSAMPDIAQAAPLQYPKIAHDRNVSMQQLGDYAAKRSNEYDKWTKELVLENGGALLKKYDTEAQQLGTEIADRNLKIGMQSVFADARKSGRYPPEFLDKAQSDAAQNMNVDKLRTVYGHLNPQWATDQRQLTAPSAFEKELLALGYKKGSPEFIKAMQAKIIKETTHPPGVTLTTPMAGVDAEGNPVFFQQPKAGGTPQIVPNIRPPEAASERTDRLKKEDTARGVSAATAKIDELIKQVQTNPNVVGARGMVGRVAEGIGGQIGLDDVANVASGGEARKFSTGLTLLQSSIYEQLVGKGQISKDDYKHIQDILRGKGVLDDPKSTREALIQVRQFLNSKAAPALPKPRATSGTGASAGLIFNGYSFPSEEALNNYKKAIGQ